MNMPQTCDPDRLDAFVRGELSEHQESELTAHLDQCAACGEELERRVAAAGQWREASELLTRHRTRQSNVVALANDPSTNGSFATSTTFAEQMDQVVGMLAPTDDPEMLGRIGGYEVSGVIGCGGMGVVFKAHDRSLDRVVAIKVMAPHLAGSGAARKRFARESKAAAAVLHPNVIAIHCVADDPKLPYLVMPYIGGASLQKRVEADGPLCTQDTLRIGQQIAAGLAAAHAQGLVHRDIKPANILLERGVERVTITDFGLARAVDDATMTRSGVIAGTPQYMSPEQARGESIDHRSDLFSLGSVLYMMCAGHSPFRAETTFGILRRITDNQPRPLREINPDVPEWLCAIIEKLHAKEPSERFQSAEEVAELLEGCLAHVQQPATIPLPASVEQLSQLLPAASTAPKPAKKQLRQLFYNLPPIGKFIAAAASAFALFFAGILIVLELDKGTLTIESELDGVPIRIMQGDNVVKQMTVTKSGKSVRVASGSYQIEIAGEFPLVSVANGIVSMKRGETETVTIAMTPPTTANSKGEPVSSDLSPATTRLLADVIRQFNDQQRADPVGCKQPLLTDDEVIAAVRAMSHEIASTNVTESNYQALRDAIERGQIPNEWTIESSNHFKLSDGRFGERWTVQLSLHQGESSPQKYIFRSRYVNIEPQASGAKPPMPEGHVSIAEWLAKVNAPDPNIYAPLPDLPVTEQEIVAALTDLIDKDQSTEFATQRKTLQEVIETRSLPKEAEISVSRPHRNRGYVSRWSNREGFENEDWTLRFEYPYTQGEKQIVTAVHLGFRSINSRPVDYVADDEIHWGPAAQDGLQFGVAIEEATLPDKSVLASTGAMAYHPHFYFRNPGQTDSTSIQLSDFYQHYEIDARTATGEQLPSKRRQGYYWISRLIFPDQLNGGARIYKHASPFVVGSYAQTLFEDSLSLEPPDGQSFESFPSVAVNSPLNTPLRIRISIPHPLFSDSIRLLSGEIRLPPLKLTPTNADTAEDEKAKDEAAKAWLSRPMVGRTLDGKGFQLTGHDALMDCVMRNNSETLNRLLTVDKYDLDFSPRDGQWTLLQTALLHECLETTTLLLQHGASPNFASKGTPLPLELAKRSGRKQLVALVQKYLESVPPVNSIISDALTHTDVEKIRDTKLLSRLKTDEERKAWEQRIDQMKKSFREYKRWGDRPKGHDTNPAGTAQTSSTEVALGEGPDIAELLETAAKHEEWVSKIGSVHFRAKGKNVQSEKALEIERAKLIARGADAVVPIKSPSLLPSFEFSDDIAWHGKQVANIRKYSLGLDNSHWAWDGTQFTTFQDGTNAAYILDNEEPTGMETPLSGVCHWPFDPRFVLRTKASDNVNGFAVDDFTLHTPDLFHGVRCHRLVSTEKQIALFIAVDSGFMIGKREGILTEPIVPILKSLGHDVKNAEEARKLLSELEPAKLLEVRRAGEQVGKKLATDSLLNGPTLFETWVSDFQPTPLGVFPMKHYQRVSGVDADVAYERYRSELEVIELQANEPIDSNLFLIEFRDGVTVVDNRFETPITYSYDSKMTSEDLKALVRKSLESVNELDALVGKPLPALTNLSWINTESRDNATFNGRPLIVECCAVGCGPCRNHFATLNSVFGAGKIQVLGFHTATKDVEAITKFAQDLKLGYPIVVDTGDDTKNAFGPLPVTQMPYTILVDASGTIVAHRDLETLLPKAFEMIVDDKK